MAGAVPCAGDSLYREGACGLLQGCVGGLGAPPAGLLAQLWLLAFDPLSALGGCEQPAGLGVLPLDTQASCCVLMLALGSSEALPRLFLHHPQRPAD